MTKTIISYYVIVSICIIIALSAYYNLLMFQEREEGAILDIDSDNETELLNAYTHCMTLEKEIGMTEFYNRTCPKIREKLINVWFG